MGGAAASETLVCILAQNGGGGGGGRGAALLAVHIRCHIYIYVQIEAYGLPSMIRGDNIAQLLIACLKLLYLNNN